MLTRAVGYGGDTDSVAAIALAAAAVHPQMKNDQPQRLVQGLEKGNKIIGFGSQYLRDVSAKLEASYPL